MIILIIIWFLLGLHSCYYLVKCLTVKYDFTYEDAPMLIVCLLVPVVTHVATFLTYADNNGEKVLFKKK